MWYVIQTMTGHEEKLVRMVEKILPQEIYTDCFVPYYERIWRKQQRSLVHVERLFPGYVFILAKDPEEIFRRLKNVPAMTKLMSDGMFTFLPLEQGEENFFTDTLDASHIVRLSYVEKDSRGYIRRVSGPLRSRAGDVARYQYKKRYALVNVPLLGKMKQVVVGIILPEDVRQEIGYGKIEAPAAQHCLAVGIDAGQQSWRSAGQELEVGDWVTVISGTLEGLTGVVQKVRKNTVDIGVRMFGQDMPMEVPADAVCKVA